MREGCDREETWKKKEWENGGPLVVISRPPKRQLTVMLTTRANYPMAVECN